VPKGAKLHYVAFGAQDPSSAFIERMRRLNLPIQKMSLSPQPFRRGADKPTKIRMFLVRPVQWLSPTKVEVVCDWPGGGTRYTLVQKNSKWAVASRRMDWIS
jgi:hypothetical protein